LFGDLFDIQYFLPITLSINVKE